MLWNTQEEIVIGVLLCDAGPGEDVQLLDTAAVDLLGIISPAFLKAAGMPSGTYELGQKSKIIYIAESGRGSEVRLTSGLICKATDSLESASKVDILYIPGTASSYIPSIAMSNFIRRSYENAKAVITICTGIFPLTRSLGDTGVLSGKHITATRMFLPQLRKEFPNINWEEKRWEHDGKLWTSGGIANGLDTVAAFIREHYPPVISAVIRDLAEVAERSQDY